MTQFASTIITDPIQAGLPSDWTQVGGNVTWSIAADTTSGYSDRMLTATVVASADITWNPPDVQTDQEVLALTHLDGALSFPTYSTMVWVRHQGVLLTGYTLVFHTTSGTGGDVWQLGYNDGATLNLLGSAVTFAWASDTWYWVRLRVSGTALSGKAWAMTVPEPKDFGSVATDSNLASGKVGSRRGSTNGINIAVFSAASGTDTAPTPLSLSSMIFTP